VWRIQPEDVTIIIDSREQAPFDLSPMRAERGTLATKVGWEAFNAWRTDDSGVSPSAGGV
jgi:hypothetical protein